MKGVNAEGGIHHALPSNTRLLFRAVFGKDRFWIQSLLFLSCAWLRAIWSGGISREVKMRVGARAKTWNVR